MYDIFFDLNNMHQTVDQSERDDEFWQIGESFDLDFGDDHADDYAVVVKKYGCNCNHCGEFYPYAEVVEGFKCWSCRNF